MSAIRSNSARRNHRSYLSSPYARPGQKKSLWGISNVLSALNPLKLFGLSEERPESPPESEQDVNDAESGATDYQNPAAETLRRRGEEIASRAADDSGSSNNSQMDDSPDHAAERPPSSSAPLSSPSIEEINDVGSALDAIRAFLATKGTDPLNRVEYAGCMSLLGKSTIPTVDVPREPFRFSTSPFPTPPREPVPIVTPSASFAIPTASASSSTVNSSTGPTPSKMLSHNPNGNLRWNGAGSARKGRNRYSSPGFGTTRPPRMKINIPPAKPEAKKRRVGESAQASFAQPAGATTSYTPTPAAETLPKASHEPTASTSTAPTASASTSRLNGAAAPAPPSTPPRVKPTGIPPKTTAPSVPSPLRHAWKQKESPSPPQPATSSKATHAAVYMTDLIKGVSQPIRAEVLNPYQSSSPVPLKPTTKKPVAKRPRPVRAAAPETRVATAEAKKDFEPLSPQKIIEATVPKGSKRSRPPPELQKARPAAAAEAPQVPRRSSRLNSHSPEPVPPTMNGINGRRKMPPVIVEEVEEEERPSPKKQKMANGTSPPPAPTVVIEEMPDVEMTYTAKTTKPSQVVEPEETDMRQRSTSPTTTTASFMPSGPSRPPFGLKTSAPKAPSKLRFSFQADKEEEEAEKVTQKPFAAPAQAPSRFPTVPSFAPPPAPPRSAFTFAPPAPSAPSISVPTPFQAAASAAPAPQKPAPKKPAPKTKEEVRAAVLAMPVTELPTFYFDIPTSSPGAGPGPSSQKARQAALAVPKSSLPSFDFSRPVKAPAPQVNGFNWAAAGMKPSTSAPGSWQCPDCMVNNSATANKCISCEKEKPGKSAAPPPTSGGFNWAAAGMKPPAAAPGSWKCSTCMLDNSPSATTKCSHCETDKPAPAAPAPATTGFNWAAAGLKPPTADPNVWKCSQCDSSNSQSVKDKCTVCDYPRP
ncbi:unnamed protein product [Somion occarium]|uniref:RanBP2-type domain-containing protein n=1 Tax=Somion occarium TaxID=3059160 RepID=A0ABP1E466_9APHY